MKRIYVGWLVVPVIFGTIGISSWYNNNKIDIEIKQKENEIIELDRNLEIIRETINQFNDDLQQINYKNSQPIQVDNSDKDREEFENSLKNELKGFANTYNVRAIDWNDDKQQKWYIYYSHNEKQFKIDEVHESQNYDEVYFTSYFLAEQAKNAYENDLIRYYTSDK